MPSTPAAPSTSVPNPAIPTRQQMVDGAVCGIFATVFNTDGTTSVRLVQVDDNGKLAIGGDATALLEVVRTSMFDALSEVLIEMRVHSLLLAQIAGTTEDLERLRQDAQLNPA